MNFIKKNTGLIIVVVFAAILRLINIDKPDGLWYDEIAIYSIASKSFPFHMMEVDTQRFLLFPIYYIIYHLWLIIFGNSDITIRLMSVFFDILSVFTAFFAGRELGKFVHKDQIFQDKTGIIYAILYAVNSSFIYYAQEAKFYSLTFFLINLLIIFWLKFLQQTNLKNFLLFFAANFLLIYTYTSQILLTIIIYLVTVLYFSQKQKIKTNLKYLIALNAVYLPLIVMILCIKSYFSGNFSAVVYDNSFILLALQNYFTPILAGLQNNILNFELIWLRGCLKIYFWIFTAFPLALMIFAISKALKDYKKARPVIIIPVIYFAVHIILSNITHYKVLVRYTLMILPFLLLIAASGLAEMKVKTQKALIILYASICLIGIISLNGAVNIKRPAGYRFLAQTLIQNSVSPNCNFVLPIRTELLDKYYDIHGQKFSLYVLNGEQAQKTYLTEEEISGIKNDPQNSNKYYKRYFISEKITPEFEQFIKQNFLTDNNIVILTDKTISMFTNEQVKLLATSPDYEKYPLQFIRLSKLNNDLITVVSNKLPLKTHINVKNWEIFVFGI